MCNVVPLFSSHDCEFEWCFCLAGSFPLFPLYLFLWCHTIWHIFNDDNWLWIVIIRILNKSKEIRIKCQAKKTTKVFHIIEDRSVKIWRQWDIEIILNIPLSPKFFDCFVSKKDHESIPYYWGSIRQNMTTMRYWNNLEHSSIS